MGLVSGCAIARCGTHDHSRQGWRRRRDALIVPPTQVPLAKERVALRHRRVSPWFLQRLNQGDTETLLRQPEAWIRQRR